MNILSYLVSHKAVLKDLNSEAIEIPGSEETDFRCLVKNHFKPASRNFRNKVLIPCDLKQR